MGRHATRHHAEWMAARVCRAAAEAGVELPITYARRLATDGLAQQAGLEVTRLGTGVVIHTAPRATDRLPVVVGYADARGQWHRDGHRHTEAPDTETPDTETPDTDGPAEAVGVGL
ncbi:MAG: hypothetical protein ACYCYA_08900 [Actinomycetes bacterium]